MSNIALRCAVALVALTSFATPASAQRTPDGRPVPPRLRPERCCLARDWMDRCATLVPRVHEEAYGPYDLGGVSVEARVRCRTETVLSDAAQTYTREMLSIEFVDPSRRVLHRREFRGERTYPIFHEARIALVRGDRESGILLREIRSPHLLDVSVSTFSLLVQREGRIDPLGSPLRVIDGVTEPFVPTTAEPLALRGDHVGVVVEGGRVDAHCPIAVDWKRGFRLPRRMTCDAAAHEPQVAPRDGTVLFHEAPRPKTASRMTRVEAGMPVRVLRTRGQLVKGRYADPYLGFADEWIEVQIGRSRGWLRRQQDMDLLGIFVERC